MTKMKIGAGDWIVAGAPSSFKINEGSAGDMQAVGPMKSTSRPPAARASRIREG
jgi:hypothetical protein